MNWKCIFNLVGSVINNEFFVFFLKAIENKTLSNYLTYFILPAGLLAVKNQNLETNSVVIEQMFYKLVTF